MNRNLRTIIFTIVSILVVIVPIWGAGISISPGASLVYVKKFDSKVPGKPLRIININSVPMTYDISVTVEKHRLKGYLPLPDTMWVRPMKNHFKVEPWDSFDVPIQISIPNDPANYNRAWVCDLAVTQSKWVDTTKVKGKAGTVLQLGARAAWLIETPTESKLPDANEDPLTVAPGIWAIQYGDSTSNKGVLPIKIRNDDNVKHEYIFESYIPNFGDTIIGRKLDIFPLTTEETGWILDPSWIRPKPKRFLWLFKKKPAITLKPGEEGEYPILIDFPPSNELGERRYEGVILIRPDGQRTGSRFVRYVFRPGLKYVPPKK